MSATNQNLMKQLTFIMRASRYFMYQNKQPFSGQRRVLAVLNLEDGLTQNYLAEVLALKPGSLAELLKKLELKGEIKRETDPDDRRVKRVYLTAAGKERVADLGDERQANPEADFFAGLTAEEQTKFSQYLEKIAAGWDADFKEQAEKFVDPATRIAAMAKWRTQMRERNCSLEERERFCRGMHRWRHHCRDWEQTDRSCANHYGHECNRDFWRDFWHNEDDER
ncbi:MarR family winged helix-turn-helix transcriptional regulator [Lactobacillus sp. ESL0677]|uniref:MarR family winged helix-turn-helix transcriptional regulator n=1 Tax=Lactobacillus sp. ESL0677 TaxID=2983208 RepID=UPI0023F86399|nr:MarR family winged helix-turn-helix transcriptional regulator [Lactobacillus sp. ESL0677]WEV37446.1 MarR family winged helix-turn-helix transcriptional regulator [Lactobacillus sp. ESL0677]